MRRWLCLISGTLLLLSCQTAPDTGISSGASYAIAQGLKADRILIDKSDRSLILFSDGKIIARYRNIRFGESPAGHKQFEGDERTPEGRYLIDRRNPNSSYHLSLGIDYPNAQDQAFARAQGRSAGGDIFIHGQPNGWPGPKIETDWTDGCIALTNDEMEELWQLVPIGAEVEIRP